MFRLMTSKTKDKWRCPTCINRDAKHVTPSSSTSRRGRIEPQATNSAVARRDDANKMTAINTIQRTIVTM